MRRAGDGPWDAKYVAARLNISADEARAVMGKLQRRGYVEKSGDAWRKTVKGNALGHATSAKSLTRKAADKKLQEFLGRVRAVNRQRRFAYRVSKVIVFGSYLGQTEQINDIDIALSLVPRHQDQHEQDKAKARSVERALLNGRRFRYSMDDMVWPEREVVLFLKARSRSLSLHSIEDERRLLEGQQAATVFEETDPPATKRGRLSS